MKQRNICLIAAAAAVVAMAPSSARADNATTDSGTSTTTTTTTTTFYTPVNIPTIAPPPLGPNGQPIDYSVLSGRNFDYVDLEQARASGFSRRDIATIAKIADLTGQSFDTIKELALSGQTFPDIANTYGLRARDVENVRDYEYIVAEYKAAYNTTGENDANVLVAGSEQELSNGDVYNTDYSENLADAITTDPNLTMFARAARQSGLLATLRHSGPYSLFVPTDAAFAKLTTDQINSLNSNPGEWAKIVNFAIVPQHVTGFKYGEWSTLAVPTLEGDPLQLTKSDGYVDVRNCGGVPRCRFLVKPFANL